MESKAETFSSPQKQFLGKNRSYPFEGKRTYEVHLLLNFTIFLFGYVK